MSIQNLLWLAALVGSIVLTLKMKAQVPEGQSNPAELSGSEKLYIWIVCIFNPIIAGAILYFGLKKKLPMKAKQANKISWMAVAVTIIGVFLISFLLAAKG